MLTVPSGDDRYRRLRSHPKEPEPLAPSGGLFLSGGFVTVTVRQAPCSGPYPVLLFWLFAFFALLGGCTRRSTPAAERGTAVTHGGTFIDVTQAAGIHFHHTAGRSGRLLLPETLGAGCAFLDYNNDGKPDLFLVNSSQLSGFAGKGPFYPALYRNDGAGHFIDVTKAAGLALDCYGM